MPTTTAHAVADPGTRRIMPPGDKDPRREAAIITNYAGRHNRRSYMANRVFPAMAALAVVLLGAAALALRAAAADAPPASGAGAGKSPPRVAVTESDDAVTIETDALSAK